MTERYRVPLDELVQDVQVRREAQTTVQPLRDRADGGGGGGGGSTAVADADGDGD